MGTGKTGGHWVPCNVGSVEVHNERRPEYIESVKKSGLNLYFFENLTKNNSHWVNDMERYKGKTVSEVFEAMKVLYTEKIGQPPQLEEKIKKSKKTGKEYKHAGWSPIREMCPPIKADTKIEDFDYFREWAKKQGIEIIRIDLHKDEGHYDKKTGEFKMNYHAHVVGSFLDWETGKTINRGPEVMSEMQTVLAISLDMERGEKGHRKEYLTHHVYREMMGEKDQVEQDMKEKKQILDNLSDEIKKANTKLKGLSTMIGNLEDQKTNLEGQIAALEDVYAENDKELAEKRQELYEKVAEVELKMADKKKKLDEAAEQIQSLQKEQEDIQRKIDFLTEFGREKHNMAVREIKKIEENIKSTDFNGMIKRREDYIEDRNNIIFSIWPAAKEALKAMVWRATHPVDFFTDEQAIAVEKALQESKLNRQVSADTLINLAKRDFNEAHTFQSWIEETEMEVQNIANHVHPLSPFLTQYFGSGGGGGGVAGELTNWDGTKIKR